MSVVKLKPNQLLTKRQLGQSQTLTWKPLIILYIDFLNRDILKWYGKSTLSYLRNLLDTNTATVWQMDLTGKWKFLLLKSRQVTSDRKKGILYRIQTRDKKWTEVATLTWQVNIYRISFLAGWSCSSGWAFGSLSKTKWNVKKRRGLPGQTSTFYKSTWKVHHEQNLAKLVVIFLTLDILI